MLLVCNCTPLAHPHHRWGLAPFHKRALNANPCDLQPCRQHDLQSKELDNAHDQRDCRESNPRQAMTAEGPSAYLGLCGHPSSALWSRSESDDTSRSDGCTELQLCSSACNTAGSGHPRESRSVRPLLGHREQVLRLQHLLLHPQPLHPRHASLAGTRAIQMNLQPS